MRKTVSGALSVLKMFKTALHGEKVVHIYWHTSAFSLRLRLSHAMHAITSSTLHHDGKGDKHGLPPVPVARHSPSADAPFRWHRGGCRCSFLALCWLAVSNFLAHLTLEGGVPGQDSGQGIGFSRAGAGFRYQLLAAWRTGTIICMTMPCIRHWWPRAVTAMLFFGRPWT